MTEVKILLVVNDAEARDAYSEALTELGVTYDIASSFEQMAAMAFEKAYQGLLVDILTLVRCSKDEKVIAYDCMNLYPVLRVKWEPKQKRIMLSPSEQTFSDRTPELRSFIETRCRPFVPRQLRRHKRKPLYLNVLVSPDGLFSAENTSKAFTVNISSGGLFLHTMESFEPGGTLWLRFIDLADQTPIAATVRWGVPWGKMRCIPGVGLTWEKISAGQEREIQRLL